VRSPVLSIQAVGENVKIFGSKAVPHNGILEFKEQEVVIMHIVWGTDLIKRTLGG
jgi:hypothetical protein